RDGTPRRVDGRESPARQRAAALRPGLTAMGPRTPAPSGGAGRGRSRPAMDTRAGLGHANTREVGGGDGPGIDTGSEDLAADATRELVRTDDLDAVAEDVG